MTPAMETKEDKGKNYIRFDWAIKRLLRNKADFGAVNGLLSCLFEKQIFITKVLESEGNQEDESDKFNRVENFNEIAKTPLDEWIYYLKTTKILDSFTAQGLEEIKKKQKIEDLSEAEQKAYYRHLDQKSYEEGVIEHKVSEAKIEIAKNLKKLGIPFDQISTATNLSIEEIEKI